MASTTRGPILSHILILLVAMLNLCILSYDAGMINNLNKVKPYYDCLSTSLDSVFLANNLGQISTSIATLSVSTALLLVLDALLAARLLALSLIAGDGKPAC